MSDAQETIAEFALSVTGYDEIAIAKCFGADLEDLSSQKQMRALAFVMNRRGGMSDADAKEAMLQASQRDVLDMFEIDLGDVMPDDPDTESGKDNGSSAGEPTT